MKNLLVTLLICFSISYISAQTLHSGNILGVHLQSINLDPDVSMNQYLDFYTKEYLPKAEEYFPGMDISVATGIHGKHTNRISVFFLFESKEVRNRYFKEDGSFTDQGLSALKKLEPLAKKLEKLGTSTYEYTDWMMY